jgi:hypothetical protein
MTSDAHPPLLREALPTVATALASSLAEAGEVALAAQIETARVHALCECAEDTCMSFYLSPPLVGRCPGEYRVVTPDAVTTIGVCDEQLGWVQDETIDNHPETPRRLAEYWALEGQVPRHVPPK